MLSASSIGAEPGLPQLTTLASYVRRRPRPSIREGLTTHTSESTHKNAAPTSLALSTQFFCFFFKVFLGGLPHFSRLRLLYTLAAAYFVAYHLAGAAASMIFVATNTKVILSRQAYFGRDKKQRVLSRQKTNKRVLSRQSRVCRDKRQN